MTSPPGSPHSGLTQPARWPIGPPAPPWLAYLARGCMLTVLILIGHWVHFTLGGVAVQPVPLPDGSGNDTGKLFNWHPILMTLAFAVFMAEAVLTYQAPILPNIPREQRKRLHAACHTAAVVCAVLGLVAALRSHSLKRPAPIPDFYSPHSWLGLTALGLGGLQYGIGAYAYGWPRLSLPRRLALGPLHRFVGMAVWLAGLAALATGVQEKLTFLQMGKHLAGSALYGSAVRVPAAVLPLLVLLAACVLFFQAPPPRGAPAAAEASGSGGSGRYHALGGAEAEAEAQGLLRGGAADDGGESGRHRA